MSKITSSRLFVLDQKFLPRGLLAWIALACLFTAPAVHAACVCGYGDGRFTTDRSLVMNGDTSDWTAILADTDNNVCDGGLDNNGNIFFPQPDRDALNGTIQSTGRDLIHFAYTWNANAVSTYTERAASDSNVQKFIYYADTNNNGLMETGERMIFATWQGNNGSVKLYLGQYVAANSAGDPLVDSDGFADGYKMPGTGTGFPSQGQPSYSGNWGSNDGLKMEWSVPWSALGIPPRTAFTFHVSSTNSTPQAASFPEQVDDNMGGCGGGAASTQYADLTFVPDRSLQGIIGGTVYAAHTLTNTGNGTDSFNLSSVLSGNLSPALGYFHDQDGSGTFTTGDALLTDTNGDGTPETGALGPGASIALLIGFTFASPESGSVSVTTTGTSSYDSNRTAAATDTLTISRPYLTILKSASGTTAKPGDVITYTVQVVNTGSDAATNVVLEDHMSPYIAWQLDFNAAGPPEEPFSFAPGTSGLTLGPPDYSCNGGTNWGQTPASESGGAPAGYDGTITNWRIPMTGTMSAGGSFTLRYKVMVK